MSKFIDRDCRATATANSGRAYIGCRIRSQTHILDIPAELTALIAAVHDNDRIVVAVNAAGDALSPLTLKLLIDHSARTGAPMAYSLKDTGGTLLFETPDVRTALPSYVSPATALANQAYEIGMVKRGEYADVARALRDAAIAGIARNFPTRDGASGYGAAVRTVEGDIYFGGQYSTPDERLGAHAEMAVLARALSLGAGGFTDVAVASSKFPEVPASPCGACRQFIREAATATGSRPTIHLFASESSASAVHTLPELLPTPWTN